MKQVLNVLLLGLISAALLFSIVIIVEDKKEPLETVITRNKAINTRVLTKDKTGLEFEILYEGEMYPGLLEGHIYDYQIYGISERCS